MRELINSEADKIIEAHTSLYRLGGNLFPDDGDRIQSGFFGRDQAAYLLDGLFNKVKPTGFEQLSARKVSAEGQYHITAAWTIQSGGKTEARDLYVTLRNKNDRWSIVSVKAAGK